MRDLRGYMTAAEVARVIEAAKANKRDHLFLSLLWITAARVSELLMLMPSDVLWNDDKLIMTILKRKRPMKAMKRVPHAAIKELHDYFSTVPMKPKDRFFPFSRQNAVLIVRRYCAAVGIYKIGDKKPHPHHFRHSRAIDMVKHGVPIPVIQQFLGHVSIGSTSFYVQFGTNDQTSELDRYWSEKPTKINKSGPDPIDEIVNRVKP